jgi:predicted transglutaminase-like cysteine proteinase
MRKFSTALGACLLVLLPFQAHSTSHADGLFGSLEIPSNDLGALPQWQEALKGLQPLKEAARQCDQDILKCQSQQMTLWRTKIQELEHSDKSIAMRQINSFINKWQQAEDQDVYNRLDYWAKPLEFITNGGDSEDFAIMKYISLRELGFSAEQMRIVVTNDVLRGVTHTILSIKLNSRSYILDSQNDTVLREEFVNYYVPYYSVNEKTRWAHIPSQFSDLGDEAGAKQ